MRRSSTVSPLVSTLSFLVFPATSAFTVNILALTG